MKTVVNEVIREDVREQLDREANVWDCTLNDVATRILSDHYQIKWVPTGARYSELKPRTKLRVPETLHRKIRMEYARDQRKTVRGIVLSILAAHYGLEPISPYRRARSSA